ncbi:MAG: serine hydrolase, partial [Pseudomonadota bacterium]
IFGDGFLPKDFPKGHEKWQHVRDYYKRGGFGDGGALSTARDMEIFYRALLQDKTLLRADAMRFLVQPPAGQEYGAGLVVQDNFIGHSGGDMGFSSLALFDMNTQNFAITLVGDGDANTDWVWDILDR